MNPPALNRLLWILCMGLLLASQTMRAALAAEPADKSKFRIAGYLPEYRFAQWDRIQVDALTDVILFSAEVSADGTLDTKRLKDCPWEKLQSSKSQHHIRLFLTIGGWERSAHFADVARSNEKRQRLIATTIRFALDHQLDGIDLDWEHPKDGDEEDLYALLLGELRNSFQPHGLQLTVTIAPWQRLSPASIGTVDFIQVMSYDHDGQHSTLEQTRTDLRNLVNAGVPVNKIVLGLPFYGRDIHNRTPMTYAEIVSKHHPDSKTDQVGDMYFNGPATIRKKTKMALNAQLGGVMVWEIGQDATGKPSLLKLIKQTVSAD